MEVLGPNGTMACRSRIGLNHALKRGGYHNTARTKAGLTLVEVLVALSISSLSIAGIIAGYLFSIAATQRAALSMAATARAVQRVEQTRCAKWDLSSWPNIDQLVATNFPDQVVILEQDASGQRVVYATNR